MKCQKIQNNTIRRTVKIEKNETSGNKITGKNYQLTKISNDKPIFIEKNLVAKLICKEGSCIIESGIQNGICKLLIGSISEASVTTGSLIFSGVHTKK